MAIFFGLGWWLNASWFKFGFLWMFFFCGPGRLSVQIPSFFHSRAYIRQGLSLICAFTIAESRLVDKKEREIYSLSLLEQLDDKTIGGLILQCSLAAPECFYPHPNGDGERLFLILQARSSASFCGSNPDNLFNHHALGSLHSDGVDSGGQVF